MSPPQQAASVFTISAPHLTSPPRANQKLLAREHKQLSLQRLVLNIQLLHDVSPPAKPPTGAPYSSQPALTTHNWELTNLVHLTTMNVCSTEYRALDLADTAPLSLLICDSVTGFSRRTLYLTTPTISTESTATQYVATGKASNKIVLGVGIGLGVPVLIAMVVGAIFAYRAIRYRRLEPVAVYRS
ncbi:hypothetical protein BT63DRAFT_453258 [Microthyrium microscopicum]|uniref:Mid2 domain-containing protein n=1 Tax=Microthyrium microscopicum TaxID=703497 RepID=A0A6A6UIJ1_9PEZI|nr:hypothetical protein BT63DRAFT_453258 [Microthyrium microscopicum]